MKATPCVNFRLFEGDDDSPRDISRAASVMSVAEEADDEVFCFSDEIIWFQANSELPFNPTSTNFKLHLEKAGWESTL